MIGKWAFIDNDEYYHTGVVVAVYELFALVKIRPSGAEVPPYYRLFGLHDLTVLSSTFFDTEAELDAWINWIEATDTDPKLTVVNLRGDKKDV